MRMPLSEWLIGIVVSLAMIALAMWFANIMCNITDCT